MSGKRIVRCIMDHNLLKQVIFDQHDMMRDESIVPRGYSFEPRANYVLTGLRRAGKSTQLHKIALDLVGKGVDWNRIVYIPFEDERLSEFRLSDFNDIVQVQSELSSEKGYFFLDEIQNVDGWEKFARRMADSKERVYITGSNSKMLSSQISAKLGGRYLTKHIDTYGFDEYLTAIGQEFDEGALRSTRQVGRIRSHLEDFLFFGGFPECVGYRNPREYVEDIYQKVLLGDIAARNGIRNVSSLRVLMKKIAETVHNEVSFSNLHGMLRAVGFGISKDTVIDYVGYAKDAYLVFDTKNEAAKFSEREGNPKYYFYDNGLLGLFLPRDDSALLENAVACSLHRVYGEELRHLSSKATGANVDFMVSDEGLAVQVAVSISGEARNREVESLIKLASGKEPKPKRMVIVTMGEEESIDSDGVHIDVVPAWRWLLEMGEKASEK
ncbi:MAG: ATP-binding protein [Coriobacteriales bacterium]|jgi:predicted AAA+ superfamily ATPase